MTRLRVLALLLALILAQGEMRVQAQLDSEGWENVGTGIDYKLFLVDNPGPNRVYVARMDRGSLDSTIESSIAAGRISGGGETVSTMARRYDGALNYWGQTWNANGRVVVAINGSYIEKNSYFVPESGQVHSGWYAKRYNDTTGYTGFGWTLNRVPFIGGCVIHPADKQVISFVDGSGGARSLYINDVNRARGTDRLVLYTPQYSASTPASPQVEVLVQVTRPTMIIPLNGYVLGYVREIRQSAAPFNIPFDHVVLSGTGQVADALLEAAQLGREVHISQEVSNYVGEECSYSNPVQWTKTYASVSGEYFYLQDGQIFPYSTPRHNRTAVGYNDQYVYFIVVDGRRPGYSVGMTIDELAAFTLDNLQATHAIALDGGGSSTMVVNGVVVNDPTDPCYFVFVPQISIGVDNPAPQVFDPPRSFTQITGKCERRTGNGLMMVEMEPPQLSGTTARSSAFRLNEPIVTRGPVSLRLGPGSNYPIIATAPANTPGVIQDHLTDLEGVYAKGQYWWPVDLGIAGWVVEESLASRSTPMVLLRLYR